MKTNKQVDEFLYALENTIPNEFEKLLREDTKRGIDTPGPGKHVTVTLSLGNMYFRKWDIILFPENQFATIYKIEGNTLSFYPLPRNIILRWIKLQWYKLGLTVFK